MTFTQEARTLEEVQWIPLELGHLNSVQVH